MTNYWLIYVFAQNNLDYKYATEALAKLKKNLNTNTKAFVIIYGPTMFSKAYLFEISSIKSVLLDHTPKSINKEITQNKTTRRFIKIILDQKKNIDALCVWAHGSGWVIGPWKTKNPPFMTTPDFINLVVKPIKPSFICYDACYMASISSLYEHPDFVKVILAAPAFHPYSSVLWTKSFSNLVTFNSKKDIFDYARKITCEWYSFTKDPFRCLMIFDTQYIKQIGELILKHKSQLHFSRKDTQIDSEESNLHDLSIVAKNIPPLLQLLKKSIENNCEKCLKLCTKKVSGISIEKHIPRKWESHFKSTLWYKKIFSKINEKTLK